LSVLSLRADLPDSEAVEKANRDPQSTNDLAITRTVIPATRLLAGAGEPWSGERNAGNLASQKQVFNEDIPRCPQKF
jgi:hypothetical protein